MMLLLVATCSGLLGAIAIPIWILAAPLVRIGIQFTIVGDPFPWTEAKALLEAASADKPIGLDIEFFRRRFNLKADG